MNPYINSWNLQVAEIRIWSKYYHFEMYFLGLQRNIFHKIPGYRGFVVVLYSSDKYDNSTLPCKMFIGLPRFHCTFKIFVKLHLVAIVIIMLRCVYPKQDYRNQNWIFSIFLRFGWNRNFFRLKFGNFQKYTYTDG